VLVVVEVAVVDQKLQPLQHALEVEVEAVVHLIDKLCLLHL
jgi:hypothetical protein